ncbi:MAG: hypothetical protein H0W56_09870 [Acidothermales bacterium]|nr:hypothetical protein [Acidothermales bacterium]
MIGIARARAAKESLAARLGDDARLGGIGVGPYDGGWAIHVRLRAPGDLDLPVEVDGVPVIVRVSGSVHPYTG